MHYCELQASVRGRLLLALKTKRALEVMEDFRKPCKRAALPVTERCGLEE